MAPIHRRLTVYRRDRGHPLGPVARDEGPEPLPCSDLGLGGRLLIASVLLIWGAIWTLWTLAHLCDRIAN